MAHSGYSRSGSIWRRWDLHIHAPGTRLSDAFGDATDAEVWKRCLDALNESPVQVFGITDYFCCDTYFEVDRRFRHRHPDSSKVVFPNRELRLSESISKDGSHPNIHVLFDNKPDFCDANKIRRFLVNLETQSVDDANTRS